MVEKCQLAAAKISELEVWNISNISDAVNQMEGLRTTRLLITDYAGQVLYDSSLSYSALGGYALLPEIVQAMEGKTGNDVFSWEYRNGTMQSRAATPIISYGNIVGCVYIMEVDKDEGVLIQSLQQNILTITFILEIVLILFSVFFATGFSSRLRKVLASMHQIRGGD